MIWDDKENAGIRNVDDEEIDNALYDLKKNRKS